MKKKLQTNISQSLINGCEDSEMFVSSSKLNKFIKGIINIIFPDATYRSYNCMPVNHGHLIECKNKLKARDVYFFVYSMRAAQKAFFSLGK